MNTKSVIATINSVCSKDVEVGVDPRNKSIKYIGVFTHPEKDSIIGIDEEGNWCVIFNGGVKSPIKYEQFYVFYTLLQSPLDSIVKLIQSGLVKKGLPVKIGYTFPFDSLILSALKDNNYWSHLAMGWLAQGYPINDKIQFQLCDNDPQNKKWLLLHEKRLKVIFDT